jgi:hypothetical protein
VSISIGIRETDAVGASCRPLKAEIRKVLLDDITGFEDVVEYDRVISIEDASKFVDDIGSFLKRNRMSEETETVYIEKIKNADDLKTLNEHAVDVSTGWVNASDLRIDMIKRALNVSKEGNRITGWDMLSFEEMTETCGNCPLSWDKGRGCIGAFGPDNSLLPALAEKLGCEVTASVPKGAAEGRTYTSEDAVLLLAEIPVLENALPEAGKMYVKRYSGVLERLKAVAEISVKERCGFYFF